MSQTIELIYFDGCPNLEAARANLLEALRSLDLPPDWYEWEREDSASPPYVKEYGSPTILINGQDVTGVARGVAAAACRADGAPSVDTIKDAMERQSG
jgi:mercuric ion transport protein